MWYGVLEIHGSGSLTKTANGSMGIYTPIIVKTLKDKSVGAAEKQQN